MKISITDSKRKEKKRFLLNKKKEIKIKMKNEIKIKNEIFSGYQIIYKNRVANNICLQI